MCSYFPDEIGSFQNINKMEINYIRGDTGMQLLKSLNVFSSWILIKSKTIFYGKNILHWISEVMSKTIGMVCVFF